VFACETIGLWFFYNHMNIPAGRFEVAFWLLQLSFAASFLTMINIPYTGLIIAHENMDIYAYISIFDVAMKLIIAFLIKISPIDNLLFYGSLIFIVQLLDFFIYRFYCIRKYSESHLKLIFDRPLFKELTSYFSWSIIGNLASVFNTEGINLLLNMFFGPAVNAARGVAVQVQNIINQFVYNFQVALNPQIVKTYANKDIARMHQLMLASAKYGFFMLFILSLPVIIEAKSILHVWLGVVPEHTTNFLRIILMSCMVNAMANSSTVAAGATGKIKLYSIVVGGLVLLPLPIDYFLLKIIKQPEIVFCIVLFFEILALFVRLVFMRKMVSLSLKLFFREVIIPVFGVIITSIWIPCFYALYTEKTIMNTFIVCIISVLTVTMSVYSIGLNKKERFFIIKAVISKIPFFKR